MNTRDDLVQSILKAFKTSRELKFTDLDQSYTALISIIQKKDCVKAGYVIVNRVFFDYSTYDLMDRKKGEDIGLGEIRGGIHIGEIWQHYKSGPIEHNLFHDVYAQRTLSKGEVRDNLFIPVWG